MPQRYARRERVARGKLSAFRLRQARCVPENIGQPGPVSGRKSWQHSVLCNRYGLPIAAKSFGEFQEASEAPVSFAILAEQTTRKFAEGIAARRGELKMARRPRCDSATGHEGHAPSSRLGGGPF